MDSLTSSDVSIPTSILDPLFVLSNASTLDKALENLTQLARTSNGRFDLASKNVLCTILQLCQSLSYPSCGASLLSALKLIRNLCAGELRNQNSFIERNGVDIISSIITSESILNDSNYGIIRTGLQVLANVSLAGKEHQVMIWRQVYSMKFVEIARLRKMEICDPLCMIVYVCVEGKHELMENLCSDHALPLLVEITRTASAVGFQEDWIKSILSRTCIEESYFTPLFSKLSPASSPPIFTQDQSFLLTILSEIINDQTEHITISKIFTFDICHILKTTLRVLNSISCAKSNLPTGITETDVLGYSLRILRDICACDGHTDIVDSLISLGLVELLLDLLRELEPPTIIRKSLRHDENQETTSCLGKLCPYLGFRSDVVSVIGNCAYRRKRVQDDIREKNGILLMLQQCVTDDENPFLREWGIWAVRNLLEGSMENQRLVSELEVQGSVDLPELARLGLRVEVDERTRRAKLVNTS